MLDFGWEMDESGAWHATTSAHLGELVEEDVVSGRLVRAERIWRGEGALCGSMWLRCVFKGGKMGLTQTDSKTLVSFPQARMEQISCFRSVSRLCKNERKIRRF